MNKNKIAAGLGGAAVVVSAVIVGFLPGTPLAGANSDSGDSSTTGYVTAQPSIPAASAGSTVTQSPTLVLPTAPTTLMVAKATPGTKATPASDCGQSVHPMQGPFECP